jgi:hypothetical protein
MKQWRREKVVSWLDPRTKKINFIVDGSYLMRGVS